MNWGVTQKDQELRSSKIESKVEEQQNNTRGSRAEEQDKAKGSKAKE
jgi:hypothetical protein